MMRRLRQKKRPSSKGVSYELISSSSQTDYFSLRFSTLATAFLHDSFTLDEYTELLHEQDQLTNAKRTTRTPSSSSRSHSRNTVRQTCSPSSRQQKRQKRRPKRKRTKIQRKATKLVMKETSFSSLVILLEVSSCTLRLSSAILRMREDTRTARPLTPSLWLWRRL
ncbi:hypothetical protein P389DRAFT_67225 [Cystobasidium minutum MCA 4210]|uniref:uncharacterized protein n=1 Tax=Cystobasidium minutum MCA 4210 TaxID=1397322 RepID=UPI0034CE5B84|eukprot:jgi/Rhomi1/67225/CE67224_3586